MKNIFTENTRHKVSEANINFYAVPFVHPKRTMAEHDFIYMLEGEWVMGQDGKTYPLKKDSLLILSANRLHYGVSPCLAGTKTMYFHVSREVGDYCTENDSDEAVDTLIDASVNLSIKKYFYETVNAKLSGNNKKADILFDLLLNELHTVKNRTETYEIGEYIKNIIHKNPERFLSNKQIAEKLNVSVKTAETKFKNLFGITIHQYMLNFKIEQAIAFFKNFPEMPVKEIAYNLGFYDEYHFSKQFKKITGISPSLYKQSNSK